MVAFSVAEMRKNFGDEYGAVCECGAVVVAPTEFEE